MDEALSNVVARLYTASPEDFVAARTEAVKLAKASGDRTGAAEIGKLRKPTVGAWLVNLLAHRRPDLVAELLALGDELRAAQRDLRGAELRELSQRRRETVSALAREARALAVAAGRGVRDPLPLAEVESTLIAALAEPTVAAEVRAGRLAKTVEYAGFGETPRPQLRLVQGGLDTADDEATPQRPPAPSGASASGASASGGVAPRPLRPEVGAGRTAAAQETAADRTATRNAGRAAAAKETAADRAVAQTEIVADRAAAAKGTAADRAVARTETVADRATAQRVAAEARAAEEAERRAAEREVQRAAATELRKARAGAHRELLVARTQLAEAEAARTAAERAVLEARRRVAKALSRATEIDAVATTD